MNIARSDVSDVAWVHRVQVHVYCGEDGGEAQHGVWMRQCACVCVCFMCVVSVQMCSVCAKFSH